MKKADTDEKADAVRRLQNTINELLDKKQFNKALSGILSAAPHLIQSGKSDRLETWADRLPERIKNKTPRFAYWMGMSKLAKNPVEGGRLLEDAFLAFDEEGDKMGCAVSAAAMINAIFLQWKDYHRLDPWISRLEDNVGATEVAASPDEEILLTSSLVCALTLRRPWHPLLSLWAERTLEGSKKARDPVALAFATGHLIDYYAHMGHCAQMRLMGTYLKTTLSSFPACELVELAWRIRAGTYGMLEENGEKKTARRKNAGKRTKTAGMEPHRGMFLLNDIISAFNVDKLEDVRVLLDAAEKHDLTDKGAISARYGVLKALYCLRHDDLINARKNAEAGLKAARETGMECFEPYAQITLAHILRATGDKSAAWEHLDKLEKRIKPLDVTHGLYLLRIVQATALFDDDDKTTCRKALKEAFRTGREVLETPLALFWFWQPAEMSLLCAEALSKDIETAYVKEVIRVQRLSPPLPLGCPRSWPWLCRIRTFGGLVIEINGEPLSFTGKLQKRPLSLLKALIALGGKDVREDTLEDILWPEAEGDSASATFRTTLSRLRQLLAGKELTALSSHMRTPFIEVKDSKVYFNGEYVWLDTWAWEVFARHVNTLHSGDYKRIKAEEIKELSRAATLLYGGPFLNGDDFYWLEMPRKRLQNLISRTIEYLEDILQKMGEDADAASIHSFALENGLLPDNHLILPRQESIRHEPLQPKPVAGGERRFLSILALTADYFHNAQSLDPEIQHEIVTECFRTLTTELSRHGGMIISFLGDGILVLFGAPTVCEDHARRACNAALSILQVVNDYRPMVKKKWGIDFGVRIGINSGLVFLGTTDNGTNLEYTAIGETRSMAVKIHDSAPAGTILVSESTWEITKDYFEFQPFRIAAKIPGYYMEYGHLFHLIKATKIASRIQASEARGLTLFVGRDDEMALLKGTFKEVESGAGKIIGIVGDAGVGKSRLLLELANNLDDKQCFCWEGHCQSAGTDAAYLPISELFRTCFAIDENMTESEIKERITTKTAVIAPEFTDSTILYDLLSLPVDDATFRKLDPMIKREKIFKAIEGFLLAAARSKPLVLIIEDLHWIDQTSRELLNRLIKVIEKEPIFLLLSYRPEFEHTWHDKPHYKQLYLRELNKGEMDTLMRALIPDGEIEATDKNWIMSKTGGNPLFLEELVTALKNKECFSHAEEGLFTLHQSARSTIPDTLLGIIEARIDALDEGNKHVLQIASAIGLEFNFAILGKVAGTAHLDQQLQRLKELGLIFRKSTYGEGDYIFKHALVQETTYETLLIKQRRSVHENIASAMEELYADRLEDHSEKLAYHYGESDNYAKAYEYAKMAAIKATNSSALWEAFRFCCKARGIIMRDHHEKVFLENTVEIASLIASPMISLGFPENSLDILLESEQAAREQGDMNSLTGICGIIGLYYSVKGDMLLGLQYSEDAHKIALGSADVALIASTAFDLCSNYAARGDFPKIMQLVPPTLRLLEESESESESFGRGYNIYSGLSAFQGFAVAYTGDFEKGKYYCEKALQTAMKMGNLYSLGLAEVFYGYVLCHQGNGKTALPHFEQSIGYLEKGQIFVLLGLATSGIGYAHYFEGDMEKALAYVKKGLSIHQDAGIAYNLCLHYALLAMIHTELGQFDLAGEFIGKAAVLAKENNEIYYIGLTKIIHGGLMCISNPSSIEEARRTASKGVSIMGKLGAKPNCAIGDLIHAQIEALSGSLLSLEHISIVKTRFKELDMPYWEKKAEAIENMLSMIMNNIPA